MIRRDHRSRKGATAVEMAIIAPILVMILFASTHFSSVFFTRHTLMLAAREGARQLAIEGATVAEAQESAEEYLNGFGITGVTLSGENAYKGNGDSAAARRVRFEAKMSAADASLIGDVLNVFGEGEIVVYAIMRKEGELTSAP